MSIRVDTIHKKSVIFSAPELGFYKYLLLGINAEITCIKTFFN